jgi:hypothetical protein
VIVWLASYPRSGNTFFRILLHRLFGFQTYELYSLANLAERMRDDTDQMMRLTGQSNLACDLGLLQTDSGKHFVKTHDLPNGDDFPAVALIRDGRDAVVSYAYYILKTERGIERPGRDLFEATLKQLIIGDSFGGWSRNVNAWMDHAGRDSAVRFEDLIADPVNIAAATLRRLGVDAGIARAAPPSFQELHAAIPWFFRRGNIGSWHEEMPSHLQDLFLERHGDTLLRLGYSEQAPPDTTRMQEICNKRAC